MCLIFRYLLYLLANNLHFHIKKLALYAMYTYLCTTKLNIKLQTFIQMTKKRTITSMLEPMQVGESKEFPAELSMSVKSMSSMLGFKWDRVYSTRNDREKRVVVVTRVS